jgi:hypothetical protein
MKKLTQEERTILMCKQSFKLGAEQMLKLIAETEGWEESKTYFQKLFNKLNP